MQTQTPLPNGKNQNIYTPKPYRTGAWYKNVFGWSYTANPEKYQKPNYQTEWFELPKHMEN